MNVGIVFASTGGSKMARALRSFRRAEPELPVHIVLNVTTNSYRDNEGTFPAHWFAAQPNVLLRCFTSDFVFNGTLNETVRWMKELGYGHACVFHDDVIFSPLPENQGHLRKCFERIEQNPELRESSGVSFSYIQAFNDRGRRPPGEWDNIDLESEGFWRRLCPDGGSSQVWHLCAAPEIDYPEFTGLHYTPKEISKQYRLGPPGFVLPTAIWDAVGGFDETHGIPYDVDYPASCAGRFAPQYVMPGVPFLHLGGQTVGYGDPGVGIYANYFKGFEAKFGQNVDDFTKQWFT